MSAPTSEVTRAEQQRRSGVARWIRRLALPIIIGWVALIVALNVSVPQLEEVGKMQAVSMSPKNAPSVAAMMRIGKDFQEFDSDSSAMIVLEGDKALGADAHRFYDDMVAKLRADTKHVQHIQDFWGDPLTKPHTCRFISPEIWAKLSAMSQSPRFRNSLRDCPRRRGSRSS